jgi:hypothetical protein
MPLIKDILKEPERKKKFQKKAYRPWDDEISLHAEISQEEVYQSNNDKNVVVDDPSLVSGDKILNLVSSQVRTQINAKLSAEDIDMEKCLRDLYGAQRIVFKFLINLQIQEVGSVFITQPIAANEIVLATKLPINTVTTVIGRLKLKKLIQTYESKPGRGGYGRYSFAENIYRFFSKRFSEA